jgi:hypothetical protein
MPAILWGIISRCSAVGIETGRRGPCFAWNKIRRAELDQIGDFLDDRILPACLNSGEVPLVRHEG